MNKHDQDSTHVVKTICKAAILNAHGQALLLRRSKTHPTLALQWDLPGGTWYEGSYEETLLREVEEETGLHAQHLKLWHANPELQENGTYKLFVSYIARAHGETITLSKEHDMYAWVGPHDAAEYQLPLVWESVLRGALDL